MPNLRQCPLVSGYFMRITLPIFTLVFAITLGCHDPNDISKDWVKSEPISDSELHAKKGDCFSFIDSAGKYFVATIVNFNKSEGGIWYAMCFTNYYDTILPNAKSIDTLKINARKVPYFNMKDYIVGFQVTWARDTLIDKYKNTFLGTANMHGLENMDFAGEGSAISYYYFLASYDSYKKERQFPEKYNTFQLDTSFHPSIYITIEEAKKAQANNENLLKSNR